MFSVACFVLVFMKGKTAVLQFEEIRDGTISKRTGVFLISESWGGGAMATPTLSGYDFYTPDLGL